ncbi:structural maintenance of chromosomes protein 2-like [Eriocheir sinensis]|uniref:structural maintenance of chromosomes protein 2-like n=1 Tax=Eriocheir sinensis TaxID=95602 RepID=UPI0021C957CB|nr:structural maintenance of chromosomes protein 2-like [Eriocheir sinensis]XP_050696446.1 structural maintenance of chromosomes protein 2-like [Eriocheir sinensis]
MYIKSIVVDGFKSYGQRTEINGFDPLFNAITGLNGSGKSNILDSICFLLGITNLSQVRATNLQELVYKNGQAGVTKATVSITFDNTDKKQSPIGYDHYAEVTITRQVVIGGRNKYMINGSTVQNSRVQDFFRSVQLNVNNPHFLIMQGRITKVLSMKPPEILAMIEEAAGTRMYEAKKQQAERTIEKKDAKLLEMSTILVEEITPTLTKLKEERSMYLEYQKVQRELEHLTKLYIAYKFVTAQETSEKAQEGLDEAKKEIQDLQKKITDGEAEVKKLENEIVALQEQRDRDTGEKLQEVEKVLKEKEKASVMKSASLKNMKETLKAEEKKKKQLEKSLADDIKALEKKRSEGEQLQGNFDSMRAKDQTDGEALAAAERRLQAISSGMYSAGDGEDATLEEQLMRAKASITEAKTATKQAEMKLMHSRNALKQKQQEMRSTAAQYEKDKSILTRMEKQVTNLQSQLEEMDYDDGRVEQLEAEQHALNQQIGGLQEKVDRLESRYPQLCFNYKEPERNFDHSSVKGLVAKLVGLRDSKTATALEVVAGGKLYNVIVDTEVTGKKLLQRGQLQSRVTFIPLNKIAGRSIDARTVHAAESLVGKENAQTALSLVCYESELHKAMEWVFGTSFVCQDMDVAKRVAFHNNVMRKCVTLEGDVFDPAGTLTGGARKQGGSILAQLDAVREFHNELNTKTQQLDQVKKQLQHLQRYADKFASVKQEYTKRSHELQMCRQRLEQSTHHQHQEEVKNLEDTMNECEATLERCKQVDVEGAAKVKELENKIKNAKVLKEQEMKAAKAELAKCKKVAEETRSKWNLMKQDEESLKLEIQELEQSIETTQGQIASCVEVIGQYQEQEKTLVEEVAECKAAVEQAQTAVREAKDHLNAQNKEIKHMVERKEEIGKVGAEAKLALQQLEHKLAKIKTETKEAENHVKHMLNAHEWIAEDRKFFGKPNTAYDFSTNDPVEAGRKITRLEEAKTRLSKSVNMRAMNMLGKAEEQYNDLMRKKRIVENDKAKIEKVIEELDEKKKAALRSAWERVNHDFGSIFTMLLPGTQAKLQPPEGQDVLDGLEFKVAFGDVWKESLTELSGGQRSLVALSLILALLLFKPAPIYILDEVDAALDLSHTQNIGNMLRMHFKQSQFIIVSLKDGMFNNANVLFKTKFVDGMSTVTRHTQQRR